MSKVTNKKTEARNYNPFLEYGIIYLNITKLKGSNNIWKREGGNR